MRDFHCSSKTQNPPLAPGTGERGRGWGGEGAGLPGARPPAAPHTQTRLPHGSYLSSVVSVFSVVQKTPLTHHIAGADLGLESPSYVNAASFALTGCAKHPQSFARK